jgi:hypothetical protein
MENVVDLDRRGDLATTRGKAAREKPPWRVRCFKSAR